MAWELVERNSNGWKHFVDSYGNDRYQKPDGTFGNRYQWGGSFGSGDVEKETVEPEEPEEPEEPIDGPPIDPWVSNERESLDSYKRARDWERSENIPIEEYPVDLRLSAMSLRVEGEASGFEMYSYGVEYIIEKDDGETLGPSARQTNLRGIGSKELIEAEFKQIISELRKIADDYKDVIVQKTQIKARDYYDT